VLDAHPPGTTYCLAAGVHRVTAPVEPERGDSIVGRPGAVLSGSQVLTGWSRRGRLWTATAYLPETPGHNGECLPAVPTCGQTHDVFLDGRRLRRVSVAAAVTQGAVYADYEANTVTVADDPRAHVVEQAVAPGLVRATVDDVTVANLVLEQAANEAQTGAVENRQLEPYRTGSGWRLLDNEVRLNHGVGLGFADATTVRRNNVHHQGQLGLGVWGESSTVQGNEISFNGGAGYSWSWEAGGAKLWTTRAVRLVGNHVHHNMGPGLWADGGNIDTTYVRNVIADNWGAGIQHEISYDARIVHNEVSGNGRRHKGWAWEAGIQVQSSGGTRRIEVAHNLVTGNANGITLIDSGDRREERPAPHGPHVVQNVWVHHNTVTMRAGQTTGAVDDTGDAAIYRSNGNRFFANTYYLDSLTETHFTWAGDDLGWDRWRGLGNGLDLHGRASLARPPGG